ncbi:hypothetical protein BOTBODRAFT_170609 [Botryobasidium botryosum FD-172 SS1]|uniref:FAD-binding domain-containing protein n=1 Tax=Botryobasidium botryosum (strain FD-172 SS1) TaxID=930990 RepID=A0A067N5W3_BOTB1|nr:hypothetical protein BOTBODRAFT_170609 [Botryobasidium botryosum FD-172 SS1]
MSYTPESQVEVLVIGAGPAGLFLSSALVRAGIRVRVVDKKDTRVTTGHADGLHPRTIEILQSYGLADRFLSKAAQIHTMAYYNPGPDGGIERTEFGPFVRAPTARYPFAATLPQSDIEGLFRDEMAKYGAQVEQPVVPVALEISQDENELQSSTSYPVKVTLKRLNSNEGAELVAPRDNNTEIVRAKYVVGADGAHSWVRKTLEIDMIGESMNSIWGVVDFAPETDLPDIRIYCTIHSIHGSCAIIPREGDLIRLYVQLADVEADQNGRFDKSKLGPDDIIKASHSRAQKMLHPYKLSYTKPIDWWTVYIIGQRVASAFSAKNRVFIAGDACHTHSPKAGQGMNASMSDSHNLAWKLASVLRQWAPPSLLTTYDLERRQYAQELIDFDRILAKLFVTKPMTEGNEGVTHEEFAQMRTKFTGFMSGIGIEYQPSTITNVSGSSLATKLIIGQRILPGVILQAANARPYELHDLLPSDMRFKILILSADITNPRQKAKLDALATRLHQPAGLLRRFTPLGAPKDAIFDIITIARVDKELVKVSMYPSQLLSHWSKAYTDDRSICGRVGGSFYANYGVSDDGAIIVCRPDGYVGMVAALDDLAAVEGYFDKFLRPCSKVTPVSGLVASQEKILGRL